MFVSLNTALRRQRRRIAVVVAMLALAGAVVTAHSVMGADHMSDGSAICLAVAETAAVIAVGGVLLVGVVEAQRPRWVLPTPAPVQQPALVASVRIRPRAGPPILQVFRL